MTIIAESLKALERNEKSIVRLESEEKSESFWGASWGFRFCFISGLFSSYMIACYDDPFASPSLPQLSPQVLPQKIIQSTQHNTHNRAPKTEVRTSQGNFLFVQLSRLLWPTKGCYQESYFLFVRPSFLLLL